MHPSLCGGVKLGPDWFQLLECLAKFPGFVDFPGVLGCQTKAGSVGAATQIGTAEGGGGGPGGLDPLGEGKVGGKDLGFEGGDFLFADQLVVDGGDGVLPDQNFLGDLGPEVAAAGSHVAVRQFEPSAGKGVGEECGVFVITPRDRLIGRVHAES